MFVRIVTYNLLVPIYAEQPSYYLKCQPEFLKTEHRWNVIRAQLEQEIHLHQNTVICLQEVSRTMLPEINALFLRMDYNFVHSLYGGQYNDYMGVGIAVPVSMELKSTHLIGIGNHIRSTVHPREKKSSFLTWCRDRWHWLMAKSIEFTIDPWEIAMSRNNTLICLEVLMEGNLLSVGTYHMPCLYQIPDVMMIHSSVVKDLMFQLAAGHSFILAGDFNFEPRENSYRAITGKLYAKNDLLPKSPYYQVSYWPKVDQILRSAYCEKNGTEPNYTNFASTTSSPNFCATLDYIFFSGDLVVDQVLELPDHPTGESYPDETHPSDHLMLAASFRLM